MQETVQRVLYARVMKERQKDMYDKKFRRLVSVLILIIIAAMVLTMVIPYLV